MLYIIVCTRNNNEELVETLNSLLPDSIGNKFKVIIVEKSDQPLPTLNHLPFPIRIIKQKSKGIYEAFNEGLNEIKENYPILFLNSGDIISPKSITRISEYIQDYKARTMFFLPTYSNGGYKNDVKLNKLHTGCDNVFPGHSASFILTKDNYSLLGNYDNSFAYMADYEFYLRAIDAGFRTEIIQNCYGIFTFGGYSSKNPYISKRSEELKIYINNFKTHRLKKLFFILIYAPIQICFGIFKKINNV